VSISVVCVDEMYQHGMDGEIVNDENTLGFWLDLYARYSQNVKVNTRHPVEIYFGREYAAICYNCAVLAA